MSGSPSVTDAPPFQAVADDPAVTETALRAFLRTPHTRMPDIRPTPQQTDDLIAYILSLKGPAPASDRLRDHGARNERM